MLTAGFAFQSAFGLGASGTAPQIHPDAVAVDPAGDTFVTGSFRGTVSFDPYSTASTLNSGTNQNAFVARYTPAGSLAWVKVFSGRAIDQASGVTINATSQGSALAIDGSGNVFVAGSFRGTVDVPNGPGMTELSSPSGTEVFAAKLDGSGNLGWLVASGGSSNDADVANGLALDGSGGVILAGSFSGTATFGPISLTAGGSSDAFAARLDARGDFAWAVATRGSGTSVAQAAGVAVDPTGAIALAGSFSGTVAFGGSGGSGNLASAGSLDAAVWKLGPAGNLLWAHRFGSTDFDQADAVAVDGSGNIYAAGAFSGTVDYGTADRPDPWTAGPIFDAFALKLGPAGNEVWARGFVGPGGWSKGQAIAVGPSGVVHLAGTFSGAVDFDPGPGSDNLTSVGSTDAFITGLDAGGNLAYALQAGRQNANQALGLGVNASGTVAITGTYTGSIGFGSTALPAIGRSSLFVARLTIPPPALPAPVLEAASDTGISPTDGITAATSPVFDANQADPADLVELLRDGVVVTFRIGPGAIREPGPLPDGTYTYTTLQVAPSGLAGPASPGTPVRILTRPPGSPTSAPSLAPLDDSGTPGDGITNVRQPRLIGSAAANASIQVIDASGTTVGQGMTGPDGSYAIRPSLPLADGTDKLAVRVVDVAGNFGAPGPSFTLGILGNRPPSPAAPALLAADNTGPPGGAITSVPQPRLSGTARAHDSIQVYDQTGTLRASGTADASGFYVVNVSQTLPDGVIVLSAVVTDVAGNVSLAGPALKLTIDTTPPAPPGPLSLVAADDSGTPGDGTTSVRQPRFSGTAEPGATVQIVDAAFRIYGTSTAAGDGTYTARVAVALGDGPYLLRARAIDPVGNLGGPGAPFTLTIDTTPPAAPSAPVLLGADDSGRVGDRITADRQPRLTGSAVPGVTVEILDPSSRILGASTVPASGVYLVSPSGPLPDGVYSLRAVAIDPAGNTSPASSPLALTILADPPAKPASPSLLPADDSGVVGDGVTAVRRPILVGSAPPNSRVDWILPNGSVSLTTTASAGGTYRFQAAQAMIHATVPVRVRVTDVAGNSGPVSDPFSLTIRPVAADSFGDGRTEFAAYEPANNTFFIGRPGGYGQLVWRFGYPGDVPVSGDFFGRGHADVAIYQPGSSTFHAFDAVTGDHADVQLGQAGDVPVPADYDGDGKTDFAVFRPSNSTFYVLMSSTGTIRAQLFADPGDVPVPADYLGSGHDDVAVYRPGNSTFYALDLMTGAYTIVPWGSVGDVPVPADYEGLGHADPAVFHPADGSFSIRLSWTNVAYSRVVGRPGDIPAVGDYFGDGKADLAVYRPGTSTFLAVEEGGTSSLTVAYGQPGVLRPVLAPLTTWFRFGAGAAVPNALVVPSDPGGAAKPAIQAALIPASTGDDAPAPAPQPTPTRKAKAAGRPVAPSGLDGWRPGG